MRKCVAVLLVVGWMVPYECVKSHPIKCPKTSNLKECEEEVHRQYASFYIDKSKADQMSYEINRNALTEYGGCRNAHVEKAEK